jgi:hypothetical protein
MKKITVLTLVTLVLLISLPFSFFIQQVSASQPIVTIEIEQTEDADVSAGSTCEAKFAGTVTCDTRGLGQNVQSVIINLVGSTDYNWPVKISPPTIVFEPMGVDTKEFNAIVMLQPETSVLQQITLLITGTATLQPGMLMYNVPPASASIKIKPYIVCEISCSNPYQCVSPGTSVDFILEVQNFGNCQGRFTTDFEITGGQNTNDWVVQFNEQSVTVNEKSGKNISIKIKVPNNAPDGKYDIYVRFTPDIEEGNQTYSVKEFPLRVEVKGGLFGIGTYPTYVIIILIIVIIISVLFWKRKPLKAMITSKRSNQKKAVSRV